MTELRVFEGALCCSTGVCGVDPDPGLVNFTADLSWLAGQGVAVVRFNLAVDPAAFAADPDVVAFLRVAGVDALPLVLVNGVTVATGRYPARAELASFTGVGQAAVESVSPKSCCGSSGVEPGMPLVGYPMVRDRGCREVLEGVAAVRVLHR